MRYWFLIITLFTGLMAGLPRAEAQSPGVDICIDDFEDLNQNGTKDTGEPPYPGVAVYLRRQGEDELVGSLTTDAGENCFRSLEPGVYTLEYEGDGEGELQFSTWGTSVELTDISVTLPLGVSGCQYDADAELNQICVLVYNDFNSNARRDAGEAMLPNININLQDLTGVDQGNPALIIRTLVTSTDFSCFTGLSPGTYRVYVPDSPNHVLTTGNDSSLSFTGQHVPYCYEFGAQPVDPLTEDAVLPDYSGNSDSSFDLDEDTRLLLAIMGAVMVILLMLGTGTMVFAIIRR